MSVELATALLGGLFGYALGKGGVPPPTDAEVVAALRERKPEFIKRISIDTSTARTNQELTYVGNFLKVENPEDASASVYIRLNEPEAEQIDLTKEGTIKAPFYRFFITNAAGTGTLNLTIGRAFGFELQDAITKVNVVAQTISEVDVNIVAQTLANLKVDLAAQSIGNLAVSIAAQTITNLLMSFNAQTVGVYLQPEWAALQGVEKTFYGSGSDKNPDAEIHVSYVVTTGKTLYITEFAWLCYGSSVTDRDCPQISHVLLYNGTASTRIDMGGNGGGGLALAIPFVVESGVTFTLYIVNRSNHICNLVITAGGYEI